MENFILSLTFYTTLTAFYLSFKLLFGTITARIIVSSLIASFISIITYKGINFLNSEPYDSYIKFSVFITLLFVCFILVKISLLDNLYLIKNYFNIFVVKDKLFLNSIFIFSYFIFYIFLTKGVIDLPTFFLTILLTINIIASIYIFKILIPLIFFFTIFIFHKFYILNYIYISLFLLNISLILITSLKLKYFKKTLTMKVDKLTYDFFNKDHTLFISKFKLYFDKNIKENISLHYEDKLKSIHYFINLNIKMEKILNKNKSNFFFYNSIETVQDINIKFNDLSFYCSSNDKEINLENLTSIKVTEDIADLEEFISQQFKMNQIIKY